MSGEQERERREPKLQQKKERKEKSLHYHHNIVGLCFSLSSFLQAERQADVMREIEADHTEKLKVLQEAEEQEKRLQALLQAKRDDYRAKGKPLNALLQQKDARKG